MSDVIKAAEALFAALGFDLNEVMELHMTSPGVIEVKRRAREGEDCVLSVTTEFYDLPGTGGDRR